MESFLTTSNITFVLGILAIIFSVYSYFRNPQIKSEKTDALLNQRVQWEKESTDKKFADFGLRLDNSMSMAQNHIHTVDVKVDGLMKDVSEMNVSISKELTRLSTIIEERIPKK